MSRQSHIPFQVNQRTTKKSSENRVYGHGVEWQTDVKSWPLTSRQIHIWNFKSISWMMTKKSPDNEILTKGNNSRESKSNATKTNLICIISRQIHIQFQVKITKDGREKSGKLQSHIPNFKSIKGRLRKIRKPEWMDTEWNDRQTDDQTDGRTDIWKPIVPPVSPVGD